MRPGLPATQVCLGAGQRFGVERPVAAQGVDGVGKVRPAGVQHAVRRGQLPRRVLLAGKQPDHGAQHHQHRREQQHPGLFFRFWHGTHPLRRRKAPSCRRVSYRKRGIPLFALVLDDPWFKTREIKLYRHSITNPVYLCKQGMFPIGFSHARWNNFLHKNNILSPDRVYIQREDVVFLSP